MNKHSFFTSIVTSLAVGLVCVTSAFAQTKRVPVIVMNTSSAFFQAIIEGAQDAASQAHSDRVDIAFINKQCRHLNRFLTHEAAP
jgi:ABC-type sugar transport system substrate-binding protein